jgi:hypothetical protein
MKCELMGRVYIREDWMSRQNKTPCGLARIGRNRALQAATNDKRPGEEKVRKGRKGSRGKPKKGGDRRGQMEYNAGGTVGSKTED